MDTISHEQARLVKQSLQRIVDRKLALADAFYNRLFEMHPTLKPLFPDTMDRQIKKLEDMLVFVAQNLNHPGGLAKPLQALAVRHMGYGAEARHYALIEPVLLGALRDLDGAEVTEAEISAWSALMARINAFLMQETLMKSA